MPDNLERDDAELLAELRAVVDRVDPIPDRVDAAARASLTWRTIDAELARLSYDSAVDDVAAAAVRAASSSRLLTFDTPGLTVDVSVDELEDGTRRVLGQLAPAQPAGVVVRHGGGEMEARADEQGQFRADGIEDGPLAFVFTLADGAVVETEWLAL